MRATAGCCRLITRNGVLTQKCASKVWTVLFADKLDVTAVGDAVELRKVVALAENFVELKKTTST